MSEVFKTKFSKAVFKSYNKQIYAWWNSETKCTNLPWNDINCLYTILYNPHPEMYLIKSNNIIIFFFFLILMIVSLKKHWWIQERHWQNEWQSWLNVIGCSPARSGRSCFSGRWEPWDRPGSCRPVLLCTPCCRPSSRRLALYEPDGKVPEIITNNKQSELDSPSSS